MPGQGTHGQLIDIVPAPAEGVDAGAQGHCAVHTAPGDDDIGSGFEGPGER